MELYIFFLVSSDAEKTMIFLQLFFNISTTTLGQVTTIFCLFKSLLKDLSPTHPQKCRQKNLAKHQREQVATIPHTLLLAGLGPKSPQGPATSNVARIHGFSSSILAPAPQPHCLHTGFFLCPECHPVCDRLTPIHLIDLSSGSSPRKASLASLPPSTLLSPNKNPLLNPIRSSESQYPLVRLCSPCYSCNFQFVRQFNFFGLL